MKKKIFIGLGIAYIIFAIVITASTSNDDKKEVKKAPTEKAESFKWLLAEHEYGDKYPYTEYYLNLYCYNDLVWLESMEGYIYPLNGLAKSSVLKKSSKYKNDTSSILKKGMKDLYTPTEAFKICLKLNDGEFKARLK